MAIPPFPSQDLAKLVLGYLAEEQLMTAYDEFLQASPYLDALRNEYDRIFMTSLKIILAEYRAVKIHVETCKPFVLRKKLLQCSNLVEVVKLLINFVDINKLHSQDITNSQPRHDISLASKKNSCDVCKSLNLSICNCQSKQTDKSISNFANQTSGLETSVETTALEDLPGHHTTTRKRHPRILERDTNLEINLDYETTRQSTSVLNISNNGLNCNQSLLTKSNENASLNLPSVVKATDTPECREKIEEFNIILNKVCDNKSRTDTRLLSIHDSETVGRISHINFQTFASGVRGNENRNITVPDSSTSENSITIPSLAKDTSTIQQENTKNANGHSDILSSNTCPYPRIKPRSGEQKIKIISDIKVDSPFPTLNNATSTPLMQNIVINGTPAYKQNLPVSNNNYTKDEIMAMPTIIVIPTSGPPQKGTQTQPALSKKIKKVKTKTTASKKLGPLVIDVSSSPVVITNKDNGSNQPVLKSSGMETGLVRTLDVTKNTSVPKDNTISNSIQTNTPQVLPPVRKSSSTPRRNSHIRVLDFTTPRRILCDKVPEEINDKSVEVVVTASPNIVYPETSNCSNNIINMSTIKVHKIETCHISNNNENKHPNKSNWDANLRALAIANETDAVATIKPPKIKNSKKKLNKSDTPLEKNKDVDKTESKKSRSKRKGSPKGKKSKRRKLEEEEEQYNDIGDASETNVAVKPTFNIVAADKQNVPQENSKESDSQIRPHNEEVSETLEAERISLQNEMGVKLNISELLETPYKQALYDIQMETPKFLGSVLPDEPISDIKIMNIPTPRFFDTPKPIQATPSYSSRGTDYSSGGSYYKPDEQDYLRIPDLECAVTSSKDLPKTEASKETCNNIKKNVRPVRRCTKNVSYNDHNTKSKATDDKYEGANSCSDTASINSSYDHKQAPKTPKTTKSHKPKSNVKSNSKKKVELSKIRKTPIKKDKFNAFMKIKPRRPTPTKDNKRTRRTTVAMLENSQKIHTKKKATGKEKHAQITPVVISAPTKSRRKSSTPRKLHCTKQFNSESSVDSPEINVINSKIVTRDQSFGTSQCPDSDTEQLALRWSDDGSQDSKPRASECEDISKIKEYIESTLLNKPDHNEGKGTLQVDLIKRGFDAETAKIIERDLLDAPDVEQNPEVCVQLTETNQGGNLEKSTDIHANPTKTDLQSEKELTEENDLELSIYECNEESNNYIIYTSETKDMIKGNPVTLRDAWSMEVCIDDGVPIRLRATSFNTLFDNAPQNIETGYSFKETEIAVSSISNIATLYTPLKNRRTECYEIFDSTLTSLDTPLKVSSTKEITHEATEIEIVVEEENIDSNDKSDNVKRKCLQVSNSPEESLNENKKTKPDAQFSFNPTNIQNIDIESVLKKLHGP